jgi:hypothetical protein
MCLLICLLFSNFFVYCFHFNFNVCLFFLIVCIPINAFPDFTPKGIEHYTLWSIYELKHNEVSECICGCIHAVCINAVTNTVRVAVKSTALLV